MTADRYFMALIFSALLVLLNGCESNDDDDDGSNTPAAKAIDVTLLHINDHHSHLSAEELDIATQSLTLEARTETGAQPEEVVAQYGGFPMLVDRFGVLAADSENVIKIHAGDAITGTLFYTLFKGEADADMMNQVCFDVFALGNHEFDDGDAGLATFLDHLADGSCDTKVLAANVEPHANSAIADGYIQPYHVMEIDGEKVGLIGIDIAGKTKNSSQPDDGTEFLDETTTAQAMIDELAEDGVNKIILVTHYQYDNDLALAANLSGVDVIVGGDSHSLLGGSGLSDLGFNPVGEYPTKVQNMDGDTVCVVQAWEYAHLLGKLDVSFDENGVVSECTGSPVVPVEASYTYEFNDSETRTLTEADAALVTAMLSDTGVVEMATPDAATETLLSDFALQTEVLKEQQIGTVEEDLCLVRFPGDARSNICEVSATYEHGSDISNIVAKAFLMVTPTADIAIQNAGGVRVDVAAGEYTIADAYTLLPFSNTLVTLNLSGQQVVDVLEDALSNTLDNGGSTGSYPYASGLRYHVDASAEKGSRISNVEVNPRLASDWVAIDTAATYVVATNDFIAAGRDGYATFGTVYEAGDYVNTYTEYAQGFVDYMDMLSSQSQTLGKLPLSEYSTQQFINEDGCNHSTQADCSAE